MKIEREDIPHIARGRVMKATSKRSNQIMYVSIACVAGALLFANNLPPMLGYALMIGGVSVFGWDLWVVSKKRKYETSKLLDEWNKEH